MKGLSPQLHPRVHVSVCYLSHMPVHVVARVRVVARVGVAARVGMAARVGVVACVGAVA